MSRIGMRRVLLASTALTYAQKALGIAPESLVGYWKLNEAAGTTFVDSSVQANNAAAKGEGEPGLANGAGPDGVMVPYFDGTDDYVNLYSAGYAADFNKDEGTLVCWGKVANVGVWTDGAERTLISVMDNNAAQIRIRKAAANLLEWSYTSAWTQVGAISDTGWMHLAITWSLAANEIKHFKDGSQVGVTAAHPNNLIALFAHGNVIGGNRKDMVSHPWSGWAAHAAIWNKALTPAEIATLAAT